MRVPSIFVNGSGSWELEGVVPGMDTSQSAPSNSEAASNWARATGSSASAVVSVGTSIAAAAASAASATSATRILERPKLIFIWAPFG